MEKQTFLDTLDLFKEAYGEENEFRMCIEEMSELTKELCKYLRYLNFDSQNIEKLKKIRENIIEETADVLNCVLQIKRIVGDIEVEKIMEQKILREKEIATKYLKNKGVKNANKN